ncbi:hypothetical protein SERLA73DRAFT_184088 [Serpula lacrymans var. lacrymans S7.3]|uniref:Uncharacterized protein n=2 Tax=Serpula lacrymans var. lacrymans TaxID=341189 RepID=F8Q2I2_SERL3|nr:uncharacterized protein SERLADRAFT_471583 [Serpula lacrymans var. lacrymans S7.9]EGN97393.1 hypothetical protein SERLA73DRAFT_184088 [Serpula lacrymans var. lacrymans S7.3]EGO22984.1 hypothetical protein SERLADRAFT_471583 [Serpula lacrymans var. lacrymans S7.9]
MPSPSALDIHSHYQLRQSWYVVVKSVFPPLSSLGTYDDTEDVRKPRTSGRETVI